MQIDLWRIEDVTEAFAPREMAWLGLERDYGRIQDAYDSLPKNVNARPHRALRFAECVFRPWYDPMMRLSAAADSKNVKVATPITGETTIYGETIPDARWWEEMM